MSQESSNVPTCATYDQYVESQLMKEFIANLSSSEGQHDVFLSSTLSRNAFVASSLSNDGPARLMSTNVITSATHDHNIKRRYTKKLMAVKRAKRTTSIALLSQKIMKLKYEILLLEEMEMLLQERMQYVQGKASRESCEDVVCEFS